MLSTNSARARVPGRALSARSGSALPLITSFAIGVGLIAASSTTGARNFAPGAAAAIGGGPVSTTTPKHDGVIARPPGSQPSGVPGTSPLVQPDRMSALANAGHSDKRPVHSPTPSPTVVPTVAPTAHPTPTPMPTATPKPPPTPTPTPTPTPPPATGANLVFGAWAGQPWDPGSLNAFATTIGGQPGLYMTYVSWNRPFYNSDEQTIANMGAAHVITWEPQDGSSCYTPRSIANGSHDTFVRAWAKGAAAWGKTIYLRPMHEMNGDWYCWGRGWGSNTPADLIGAWRHLHDIFVQEGATKVKWVWCPNVRYGAEYPIADIYPGSAYVDWTCLDGYNWGSDPHLGQPAWQSFPTIFGSTYTQLLDLAPGKPMMIGEMASTEHGGDKAAWITKTYLTDIPKYSAIKAVVWFNQTDGASDFRVNSSAAALAAIKQVRASALWSGKLP